MYCYHVPKVRQWPDSFPRYILECDDIAVNHENKSATHECQISEGHQGISIDFSDEACSNA